MKESFCDTDTQNRVWKGFCVTRDLVEIVCASGLRKIPAVIREY